MEYLKFKDGLKLSLTDFATKKALDLYREFDATPLEGGLELRSAALLSLAEQKSGKGAHGAVHQSEALVLCIKYGPDAVQSLIDQNVITGL